MSLSTRFSVATHIMALLYIAKGKQATSDYLAASIGTNPVVVRRMMSHLKKADLILSKPGVSETVLTRDPSEINLLEVYKAVTPNEPLFDIHQNTNPACIVGANIQEALSGTLLEAQNEMEQKLKETTLADVIGNIYETASRKGS